MSRNLASENRWRSRTLIAIVAGTGLLGTTMGVNSAGTIATAGPGDVGAISTSMVEMLDGGSGSEPLTLEEVAKAVEAFLDDSSLDGTGVDVALIDTGVAPVDGLDGADKVLHGPDLSFEAASPDAAYLDTYGHGTHMAGIIAGERAGHEGIAPGARLVSIKTAGHDGFTTVPQVVAAIDWVVDHRNSDGLNIRVLNLSLGLSGVEDHRGDLLSAAVERAWNAGIFVVVAAGNGGEIQKHLDSPAIDPYVLAVSAHDYHEDDVPVWSANGNGYRNPDLIAAGRSIASYRVPGSTADNEVPSARYGDDLFLGSGTSQAAAVLSGVAALILQAEPWLTPDQLKATLTRNSEDLIDGEYRDGSGVVSANKAEKELDIKDSAQEYPPAAGKENGIVAPTGATWSGGGWSGATWTGATWTGATWSGATWSGATWSGATWSGATWSGATWSGATWTGSGWS